MKKIKPVHIILFGFLFVILIGSVLLTLPISSKSGEATPYINALFTSTTSVCVTGLVVETTMTYWSTFGQLVILVLIQLGGLGVITFTTGMFLFLKKKLTMKNRMLITMTNKRKLVPQRLCSLELFLTFSTFNTSPFSRQLMHLCSEPWYMYVLRMSSMPDMSLM